MKAKLLIALLFVIALMPFVYANTVPVTIEKVKVDDIVASQGKVIGEFSRGEDITVGVELLALADDNYIKIRAEIVGYEYSDKEGLTDETDLFSVKEGETYYKTLHLKLPTRIDQDRYKLRIIVLNRDDELLTYNVELAVHTPRHYLTIKDVVFSPSDNIKAGRAFTASVRVHNYGEKDEKDVKVVVSLPDLGVEEYTYIDEVQTDESVATDELLLRIPACAQPGTYKVVIKAIYKDGDLETVEERNINIISSELCMVREEKTTITLAYEAMQAVAGEETFFPLTILNEGNIAKTYVVEATAPEGVDLTIEPSTVVVLQPNEAKTLTLKARLSKDLKEGEKVITVKINKDSETIKELTFKVNVVEESKGWETAKKVLEIILVVLVIVLIVIGLILAFRARKGKESKEEEEEIYY